MKLRYWFDQICYRLAKALLRLLCWSYFRVSSEGRENVPKRGPVLLACHHSSYMDPLIVGVAVPRIVSYLAREDLFRPPLKWLIEHLFAYPISRDSRDMKAMRLAQSLLKEGRVILVFPEGTRTDNGKVKSFKAGVGWIALRTQVPVVPVYVEGAYRCWPRSQGLPRPGKMRVFFGPPLLPEHYADAPRNRQGFTRIAEELERRVKNLEKRANL